MTRSLILASSSPRRRELIQKMGLAFTVQTCPVDERVSAPPREAVAVLAERKARAVADCLTSGLVLGADTLVSLNGKALGKPRNQVEARKMLESLSGKVHQVFTGICLMDLDKKTCRVDVDETKVRFRVLTEQEIASYIHTGEPMDKAGAYAIQGGAGAFVEEIQGSLENVIGLPIQMLWSMLEDMED